MKNQVIQYEGVWYLTHSSLLILFEKLLPEKTTRTNIRYECKIGLECAQSFVKP
jgi:hypothetical protein